MALIFASLNEMGHLGHMQRRSFADVKAHLSEVVDQAEHRGKKSSFFVTASPLPLSSQLLPFTTGALRRASS